MVTCRTFRNSDPPHLRRLWDRAGWGPHVAVGCSADAFETVVFAKPYFDPRGCILAEVDQQPVGFVHAGFSANAAGAALDHQRGVIATLVVDPAFRRRGIGRTLLQHAEEYLRCRGATTVVAGGAHRDAPFYGGLYGGTQPCGFLQSDSVAEPFLTAAGYTPDATFQLFQRSLADRTDPVSMRLLSLRKQTQLAMADPPRRRDWWWDVRVGRLDPQDLVLVSKSGGTLLAMVTLVGLDFYWPTWQERAVGFLDLYVPEEHRRKGYAQALLVEVCRRLRGELITRAQLQIRGDDLVGAAVARSAGFQPIETATTYVRALR